ncbi:MAG: ABC transporter ATP-binding protein [Eubacteriales bacterium]|mgnify:FL=1|nr:ABC transporter ATP-binding protein [Eubacteriales bacterium]
MKTISRYYKKYIPFILLIIGVLFGQAMCELALPGYMSDIINEGIIMQDMDTIYRLGIIMIAVTLGSGICAIAGSFLASRTAAKSARDIRSALFRKVTSFSDAEMDQFSTASLITRSTNDVQMIQQASVMILRMAFYAPIMGVGALIKALNTNVSLTWTIGLAVAVIFMIMLMAFFLVLPKFKVLQMKLDRLNLIMKERLSGLLVVRGFARENYEQDRFDAANTDLMKINVFVNKAMSLLMPALMLIMNLSGILIVWFGSKLIEANDMMIGEMLAFLQYSMQIIMSFLFITMMFIMVPRAAVSAQRIGKVLVVEPSVKDSPAAVSGSQGKDGAAAVSGSQGKDGESSISDSQGSTKEAPVSKGILEFENVSFAYPDSKEKTLCDINFTVSPGKTTAIIGGTGSGKTTLVRLITRFYDVTGGRILLDGNDIRDIPQKDLRDVIGYVPQKGILFSGTIADNLRFGKEDASPEEMEDAAETAQALDFIKSKNEGFEELITEGGTNVSGGQKQRISIARALIKDPHIYIFDDTFSALDFKTDAALRKALKQKIKDASMIIVAQRINTIMDADQIIVLDEGEVAGKGTHKELLSSCDVYREIALSQLSEEELGREMS